MRLQIEKIIPIPMHSVRKSIHSMERLSVAIAATLIPEPSIRPGMNMKSESGTVGSCNMAHGHKVCSNRYVTEESFIKLFMMSWNEIVSNKQDYKESRNKILAGDDILKKYKTKLIMEATDKGLIEEFDPDLMMAVVDYMTVFEDGRLRILFHDGTEFEVATE